MDDGFPNGLELSAADILVCLELIDRAYAFAEDAPTRRGRLMDELSEVIGIDFWFWAAARLTEGTHTPAYFRVQHSDLSDEVLATYMQGTQDPDAEPPENPALAPLLAQDRPFTRRREELVSDEDWYASPHYTKHRSKVGFNEFVYCFVPLGQGSSSGVGMHRVVGRPAFSVREAQIAHLVLCGARSLHHDTPPPEQQEPIDALTSRQRMVMGLLAQGWERKRIAGHLGLTGSTVRDHCRKIYRLIGVQNQRQLMARFAVTGHHPSEADTIAVVALDDQREPA
jgi:DNA-binding CsgD family transcriptional regulator